MLTKVYLYILRILIGKRPVVANIEHRGITVPKGARGGLIVGNTFRP